MNYNKETITIVGDIPTTTLNMITSTTVLFKFPEASSNRDSGDVILLFGVFILLIGIIGMFFERE